MVPRAIRTFSASVGRGRAALVAILLAAAPPASAGSFWPAHSYAITTLTLLVAVIAWLLFRARCEAGRLRQAQAQVEQRTAELARSVDWTNKLLDEAHVAVVMRAADGTIRSANRKFAELLDVPQALLVGRKWSEVLPHESQAVNSGHYFTRVRVANGDDRWLGVHEGAQEGRNGEPLVLAVAADITDVIDAERNRQEATQTLQLAVRAAAIGTFTHDLTTGEFTLDAMGREIYGIPQHMPADEVFHAVLARIRPEDRDRIGDHMAHAKLGDGPEDFFVSATHDDGLVRQLRVAVQPVAEPRGHRKVAGVVHDVTAEQLALAVLRRDKQALEAAVRDRSAALDQAHALHALAIEAGELGLWDWDFENGALNWSARCRELHGKPLEGPLNISEVMPTVHDADRESLVASIQRATRDRSVCEMSYRVHWPDGSVHWLDAIGRVIYEGDRPARMAGVVRRVPDTEGRTLAEGIPQMVWVCEVDGRLIFANQRWLRYTGTTLESNFGLGWLDVIHADDRAGTVAAVEAAVAGAVDSFEHQYRVRTADGSYRWCIGRAARLRDATGQRLRWYGTTIDVHELQRALEQAEGASRAKAAFLATTSHELRTPLNSIIGFTRLVLDGAMGPVQEEQRKPLDIVHRSGQHLLALVQDVLDFSAIEAGSLRIEVAPTRLAPLLQEARDSLLPRAMSRGLELHEVTCDPALLVVADPVRLAQAVRNLIANALTYTDRGFVRVLAAVDGHCARIEVIDSGIGVPADQLHKIFQAFQPIRREEHVNRQGTGLGLVITRRLIENMGGAVGVESESGKGSRFWVTVPLAAAATATAPARPPAANAAS